MAEPETFTNSSLACARRCLTEYDFRYLQLLEVDSDEAGEALAVGWLWHLAHHAEALHPGTGLSYTLIGQRAPSPLWAEKLRRLFAAYAWYWEGQPLRVVEPEWTFSAQLASGRVMGGQVDAIVELEDLRRGVLERKTSGENVEAESDYWRRLRMDPQVGIYALACTQRFGSLPSFILYDVVRKPTIQPKSLSQKEVDRMRKEIAACGAAVYFAEGFLAEELELPLSEKRESVALYGARLTADIGDRPGYYFGRREVARQEQDYATLRSELLQQTALLQLAESQGCLPRNPDACFTFGRPCDFYQLCSNNVRPRAGDPPPQGYRRRRDKHPELAAKATT
jgi:hypothetical protein